MKNETVDMSAHAVAARIDTMRELYDLMKYLARFRPVEPDREHETPGSRRPR